MWGDWVLPLYEFLGTSGICPRVDIRSFYRRLQWNGIPYVKQRDGTKTVYVWYKDAAGMYQIPPVIPSLWIRRILL
ncbi:MAG: hypothetical protein HS132_07035 [Planctomycetia bacterium]|nr:hypothetical protein [Planctomycetia bacterium]